MTGNRDSFDWDDAAIEQLRNLWREGHSTAEIGRSIGVSKNAVIGKARRLRLPGRPSPIRSGRPHSDNATKRVPVRKPASPPQPAEVAPPTVVAVAAEPASPATSASSAPSAPPDRQLSVRAVREGAQCCWPIGEPGRPGFRFCDAPLTSRLPYCLEHARKAYVRLVAPGSSVTR